MVIFVQTVRWPHFKRCPKSHNRLKLACFEMEWFHFNAGTQTPNRYPAPIKINMKCRYSVARLFKRPITIAVFTSNRRKWTTWSSLLLLLCCSFTFQRKATRIAIHCQIKIHFEDFTVCANHTSNDYIASYERFINAIMVRGGNLHDVSIRLILRDTAQFINNF